MSKFKVKLKLQGFELEIEGARDDMHLIGQNIGQQMAGLLQPTEAIVEGRSLPHQMNEGAPAIILDGPKKSRKRRQAIASNSDGSEAETIDWKHDSTKYGMPSQEWNTAKKAMWVLYVVKEEKNIGGLTARMISNTFNKHFKQAGLVQHNNTTRDLGKLKIKKGAPVPVGEDTTKNPSEWFLTDEGRKQVQGMITDLSKAA